jgi:hypothetical protein
MGVAIMDLPADSVVTLPDRLREAGFEVEICSEPSPEHPDVIVTLATCRRGGDTQRLGWNPVPGQPVVYRVGIGMARGWRRSVRERRLRMHQEITSIVEASGGYWPFEDKAPERLRLGQRETAVKVN